MATVTQILDRVCGITGYDTTGGGTERVFALSALNDAYMQAVERSECHADKFSKTLTSGTAEYEWGTAPVDVTGVLRILDLWVTDSSGGVSRLRQLTDSAMRELESGSGSSGTPAYYSFPSPNRLNLYPTPGSGVTLGGIYIADPPVLVESGAVAGQETTPSVIPSRFHYSVLGNLAVAICFERDNRFDDANYYRSLFEREIEALSLWVDEFGGAQGSPVDMSYTSSKMPDVY
jgi:hypothetical protein